MFLTPEELQKLTGLKQSAAQARSPKEMGIEYRARTDGSLVVLRATVEIVLGAGGAAQSNQSKMPQLRLRNTPRGS